MLDGSSCTVSEILVDMQPHDSDRASARWPGTLSSGQTMDRLGTERHHQRPGQQHGTDCAVHLGHFMRQQHKPGDNVHKVVLFYCIAQHLRRVHRQRLTGVGAAARVENTADSVAARIADSSKHRGFRPRCVFPVHRGSSCTPPAQSTTVVLSGVGVVFAPHLILDGLESGRVFAARGLSVHLTGMQAEVGGRCHDRSRRRSSDRPA